MNISSLLLLLFAAVVWAVDLPTIVQNYGISAEAKILWDQVAFHNKIRFDADTAWSNFVTTHGEDHLTGGITKISSYAFLGSDEKDKIRGDFRRFLSAPSGELSVPEATDRYLLKHLINAYDLSRA